VQDPNLAVLLEADGRVAHAANKTAAAGETRRDIRL